LSRRRHKGQTVNLESKFSKQTRASHAKHVEAEIRGSRFNAASPPKRPFGKPETLQRRPHVAADDRGEDRRRRQELGERADEAVRNGRTRRSL
jgi:hypothetical protein